MVPKGGQVFDSVYPALVTIQDASKESSVAKAYLISKPLNKALYTDEAPHMVSLLMCRAKLAPLTSGHTAPRGELTCLYLSSCVTNFVTNNLPFPIRSRMAISDSKVALSQASICASYLTPAQANLSRRIQTAFKSTELYYSPRRFNSADAASHQHPKVTREMMQNDHKCFLEQNIADWPIEKVKVADIKGDGILKIYKDLKIFKEGSAVDFSHLKTQENLRALEAYDAISDFETLYMGNIDMDFLQMKGLNDAIFNSDVNSKLPLSANCHKDVKEYINKFQDWSADEPPKDSEQSPETEEHVLSLSSVAHSLTPPDWSGDSESLNQNSVYQKPSCQSTAHWSKGSPLQYSRPDKDWKQ